MSNVSKIETGFGGLKTFDNKMTGLTQASTENFLYLDSATGNVTYDVLRDVEVTGNLSVNSNTLKVDAANNTVSTHGSLELQNAQSGKRWRQVVTSDETGNYFEIQNFVNSQWQSVIRIDEQI